MVSMSIKLPMFVVPAQAPSPPHRLDSMYFKQKPCVPHEGGDGEEEGDHSPSSLFDSKHLCVAILSVYEKETDLFRCLF